MTYYIAEAFVISGEGRTINRQRVLELPDPRQRVSLSLLQKQTITLPGFAPSNCWGSRPDEAWEFADPHATAKVMRERGLTSRRCFLVTDEDAAEWYRRHHLWRVKRKAAQIR